MKKPTLIVLIVFLLAATWYGIWYVMLSSDVARIRSSIDYHNQRFKTANRAVELRADAVKRTGFPFGLRVKVVRPTLSMIWGKGTFAVSIPEAEFDRVNAEEGRYRVTAPAAFDALYATDGQAPEKYTVSISEVPRILIAAQIPSPIGGGSGWGRGVAKSHPDKVPLPSSPLQGEELRYLAASMPKHLLMTIALNGKSKQVGFDFTPLPVPVFFEIPKDASSPLMLFVGMLREAMIYRK